jgi:hypothetical protein
MSKWFSAQRLIGVGATLLLAATAVGLSLRLFESSGVREITSIIVVAVPLSILVALVGFLVTLAGAVRWAFQASTQSLAQFGIACLGLGIVCFIAVNKIQFGFDDERILFAQLITYAPLLVGVLFLLFAGFRRLRATFNSLS